MEHRKGRVVPLLLESCDVSQIHLKLLGIQHVDLRYDRAGGWERLQDTWSPQSPQVSEAKGTRSQSAPKPIHLSQAPTSPKVFKFKLPAGLYIGERWIGEPDSEWRTVGEHPGTYYFTPGTHISLSSCSFSDANLIKLIQKLRSTEESFITARAPETSPHAGPFLSRLSLSEADNISDASMEFIGQATTLTELDLSWTSITDWGLGLLRPIKQLRHLEINGCYRVGDRGFEYLSELTNLRHLEFGMSADATASLYDSALTSSGVRHLAKLRLLEHLDLTRSTSVGDQGIAGISALSRLRHLDLGGCHLLTDLSLGIIGKLTELELLDLHGCARLTDSGIRQLSSLIRLRELHLEECEHISDAALEVILQFPLKKLRMRGCNISNRGLDMIAGLETITELTIGSHSVSEEGIRCILRMRNLDRLNVDIKKSTLLSKKALVALLGKETTSSRMSDGTTVDLGWHQMKERRNAQI